MLYDLRCKILNLFSYRQRVALNAQSYLAFENRSQLPQIIDRFMFTKGERIEREELRVLELVGSPIREVVLARDYFKKYGFASLPYYFNHSTFEYLPDIRPYLDSLVKAGKIETREEETTAPVELTGPESAFRYFQVYWLSDKLSV